MWPSKNTLLIIIIIIIIIIVIINSNINNILIINNSNINGNYYYWKAYESEQIEWIKWKADFLTRGNWGSQRKTSRTKVENQQTSPTHNVKSVKRTQVTLAEGKLSHLCNNPASLNPNSAFKLWEVRLVQWKLITPSTSTTNVVCEQSFSRSQPDFKGFLQALCFLPSSKSTPIIWGNKFISSLSAYCHMLPYSNKVYHQTYRSLSFTFLKNWFDLFNVRGEAKPLQRKIQDEGTVSHGNVLSLPFSVS